MPLSQLYVTRIQNRFEQEYLENFRWRAVSENVSGELASGGDTVRRVRIITEPSERVYQEATQMGAPQRLAQENREVAVDFNPYFRFYVDVIEEQRYMTPSGLREMGRLGGLSLAEQANNNLRASFVRGLTVGNGGLIGPDTGGIITTTAAGFGNDAHKDKIYDAIRRAARLGDSNPRNIPRGGNRVLFLSPRYFELLSEELESRNVFFQSPIHDDNITRYEVARLFDWRIVVDNGINSAETAGSGRHGMHFIDAGTSVSFAEYPAAERSYTPEGFNGTTLERTEFLGSGRLSIENKSMYIPTTIS